MLDPFLAEHILLLPHLSATIHKWTHLMICAEANFPPAFLCDLCFSQHLLIQQLLYICLSHFSRHIYLWFFMPCLRPSLYFLFLRNFIWVRSRRCGCLVTWFCYHLIAKPGNKTAAPSWTDPYYIRLFTSIYHLHKLIKLEHIEHLHSEDNPPPCHLMITHTIDSYWIQSQNKTKSKLQI